MLLIGTLNVHVSGTVTCDMCHTNMDAANGVFLGCPKPKWSHRGPSISMNWRVNQLFLWAMFNTRWCPPSDVNVGL